MILEKISGLRACIPCLTASQQPVEGGGYRGARQNGCSCLVSLLHLLEGGDVRGDKRILMTANRDRKREREGRGRGKGAELPAEFKIPIRAFSAILRSISPLSVSALQPAEHEAAAPVRHGAVDVHGGGAAEALPADARVHEALQRRQSRGRHRQGQARVSAEIE